jgi:hypothetical protein
MPTLICPVCKSQLTIGDDRAGTKRACPKCATAISLPVVAPALAPIPSRRKKLSVLLRIGLGLALLVTVCVVGWLLIREPSGFFVTDTVADRVLAQDPGSVDLSGDGPDWTYEELLDQLRAKGLKVSMAPCGPSNPSMLYALGDQHRADSLADEFKRKLMVRGANVLAGVLCVKMQSAKEAKEAAARSGHGNSFSWGRFHFYGPVDIPSTPDRIRTPPDLADYNAIRKALLNSYRQM